LGQTRGCTPDCNALHLRYYRRLRFDTAAMSRIYATRFDDECASGVLHWTVRLGGDAVPILLTRAGVVVNLLQRVSHAMHLHIIHEATLQCCSTRTVLPLGWVPASISASAAFHSIAATPRRSHSNCRRRPRQLRDHA
jgi:hypothetical protein